MRMSDSNNIVQLGQEYPPKEEAGFIQQMIGAFSAITKPASGPDGLAVRQGHSFMHGCVNASFVVEPNLPADLQAGIFKDAVTFPAYIRFSNASAVPVKTPDAQPDMRGMAIKLMNVPGEKILDVEKDRGTQDFLLLTHPVFTSKSVAEFVGFVTAVTNPDQAVQGAYFSNPDNGEFLGRLQAANKVSRHLLEENYWSTVPIRFGEETKAVKFLATPTIVKTYDIVSVTDDNYLRANLKDTLSKQEVSFDFMVQFQKNPVTEPIEDATIEWKTDFIKVATLIIPVQDFDTAEQNILGENLAFTPWNCLKEHKPLGGMNRARLPVYEAMEVIRHEQNHVSEV